MAASRRRSTRSSARVSPGPYICGEQFTAADVYVGAQIGWGMMFGTIDKRPGLRATISAGSQARPAAIRAREIDDALIAAAEAAAAGRP